MFASSVVPVSISHIAVVIVVHEGDSLASCLESVSHASELASVHVSVTVVGDGCLASTLDAARGIRGVRIVEPGIGARIQRTPRAVGASFAVGHTGIASSQTWIANTEANYIVPENWLVDQIALADGGADIVVGAVEDVPVGRPSGANLGIWASSYLAAGGFRAPAQGADADLVARAAVKSNVVFEPEIIVFESVAPRCRDKIAETGEVRPVQNRELEAFVGV